MLVVYLLAGCFSITVKGFQPLARDVAVPYKEGAFAVFSTPRVLRGEEPHFLMLAHALAGRGDLRVSPEYTHSLADGPERGVYWTGQPAEFFLQHFARKPDFALVGTHPPGMSILLALVLWPLAGTPWMEAGAIWFTAFVGALGVLAFVRILEALGQPWPVARNAALVLAFATPWFSYSRTLYTEVYLGVGFLLILLAMLRGRWWWALGVCVVMAWIKYPALLMFAAVGCGAVAAGAGSRRGAADGRGEGMARRRAGAIFFAYAFAGAAVLLSIFLYNRALYGDTTWITGQADLRAQSVSRAGAPIAWAPGDFGKNLRRIFTSTRKGLFPHCPVLLPALFGLVLMARDSVRRAPFFQIMLCVVPFTLLHISYKYLLVGESYTVRYLVPMVPLVLLGLPYFWKWSRHRPWWRRGGAVLLILSVVNNLIAGFFPALTFRQPPWEIWAGAIRVIAAAGLFFREHTGDWAI